jgi:hypothetical protein
MEALEGFARDRQLLGSFALLAATAVLTIPYERMSAKHPLFVKEKDDDLSAALKQLEKVIFLGAPFWKGQPPGYWYQTRVVTDINDSKNWRDPNGHRPLSKSAENTIAGRKAAEVLRPLRNALAHGNVFYLNAEGREVPGEEMKYLGFASRYEELTGDPHQNFTYRLVVAEEEAFFRFVRAWADWVSGLDKSQKVSAAA